MIFGILRAFIIGIAASVPMGPVAILVIQKSLCHGHKSGFMTGLGACLVDTVFAIVAIFALAYAQMFMSKNETMILFAGGLIIALMGCFMALKDPFRKLQIEKIKSNTFRDFMMAFIMGISNPGAILVTMTLFAFFGMELDGSNYKVAPVILAFSAGSATYWFFFSWIFSHFRKNFKLRTILWINRLSGIVLIIIGLAMIAERLFQYVFNR